MAKIGEVYKNLRVDFEIANTAFGFYNSLAVLSHCERKESEPSYNNDDASK